MFEGMGPDEIQAAVNTLNEQRHRELAERERIHQASKKFLKLPPEQWPPFEVLWDLSPASQHYALDGESAEDFAKTYPDGLIQGWADLADLDRKFTTLSLRTISETWSIGEPGKVARNLVHWVEGRSMAPPFIAVVGQQLHIAGGHHRIAVFRAKLMTRLPFLAVPDQKIPLEAMIPSLIWSQA